MDGLSDLKSWCILPTSMRFKPPSLPDEDEDGIGQARGPICPGHFIPPKCKEWNKIINRSGPLDYPPEMPIYLDQQWNMSWKMKSNNETSLSVKAAAPVAETVGATANADAEAAFSKSVTKYMDFERLDTYMLQPWDPYISSSLRDKDIAAYIDKHKNKLFGTWELYMISGIIVARGATLNSDVAQDHQVRLSGGFGAQELAHGSGSAGRATEQQVSLSAGSMSDFVWAIQIARVYKNVGQDWRWETLWDKKGSGSTFAVHGRAEAIMRFRTGQAESTDEVLSRATVFGLETGTDVFVLPDEY